MHLVEANELVMYGEANTDSSRDNSTELAASHKVTELQAFSYDFGWSPKDPCIMFVKTTTFGLLMFKKKLGQMSNETNRVIYCI